jgi:PKD repeat protein
MSGTVSDADGPEQPLAAWDFGDDTETVYGTSVVHTYARPGKYVVKLRATDSCRERAASVAVTVSNE